MNSFYHITAKIAKEKYFKFKSRLERSISSGKFDSFSRKKKNQWISRVEKYRLKLEHFNLSKGAIAAGSVLTATAVAAQTPNYEKDGTLLLTVSSNNVAVANLDDDADFEILFSTNSGAFISEKDGSYDSPIQLSNVTSDFVLGDLDGDGVDDVLYQYNDVLYRSMNDGYGAFTVASSLTGIGINANTDVEVVDFDSDGDNDIVWTSGNSSDIYWLANDGSGTAFSYAYLSTFGSNVHEIELADLDDDGDLDMVILENYQLSLGAPKYVYNDFFRVRSVVNTTDGEGEPTLGNSSVFFTGTNYYSADNLVMADLDNDGDQDVVFENQTYGGTYIRTALGNHPSQNSIGFNNEENYYLNYSDVNDIGVTDFDNDGDLDVLVSSNGYLPYLLVNENQSFDSYYLGDGSGYGEFSYSGISLAIGDLDDDGLEDVITAGGAGLNYGYINNVILPDPEFVGRAVIDENTASGTIIGRIESYGNMIANPAITGDDASFFAINASTLEISLASSPDWEALERALELSVSLDVNGEAATINQTVGINNVTEDGEGTISSNATQPFGFDNVKIFMSADVDADGDQDVFTSSGYNKYGPRIDDEVVLDSRYGNTIFNQVTNGVFAPEFIYDIEQGASGAIFMDVDMDGDLDLVFSYYERRCCVIERVATSGGLAIAENQDGYFNGGENSFVFPSGGEGGGGEFDFMAKGDLDGDGIDDLVVANDDDIFAMHGVKGGFDYSTSIYIPGSDEVSTIHVGDIDGDGTDDLTFVSHGNVYIKYGYDEFFDSSEEPYSVYLNSSYIRTIDMADLDGDGDDDFILHTRYGVYAAINGGEGFDISDALIEGGEGGESSYGGYGTTILTTAVGDLDGDDDIDLVSLVFEYEVDSQEESYEFSTNIVTHLNDGQGDFTLSQTINTNAIVFPGNYEKYSLDLIDTDGDDDLDVVVNSWAGIYFNYGDKYEELNFGEGLLVFENENVAPTGITLDGTSFDENLAIATQVATVSVEDPNINDTHTLFMTSGDGTNDADNSRFVIDGDRLLILESPDFESQAEYNINIKAIDEGFNSVTAAFTLTVNDIEPEVSGIDNDQLLTLYPNPGRDLMILSIDNAVRGAVSIKVSDISGRVIHELVDEKRYDAWTRDVPMASQEPGVYIVELSVDGQTFKQRWIKK